VNAWPIQPSGGRKKHQSDSNQFCAADSHTNESNHTFRPHAIENTANEGLFCGCINRRLLTTGWIPILIARRKHRHVARRCNFGVVRLAGRPAVPFPRPLDPADRFAHQFVGVGQPQFVLDAPMVRLNRLRGKMNRGKLTAVPPLQFDQRARGQDRQRTNWPAAIAQTRSATDDECSGSA